MPPILPHSSAFNCNVPERYSNRRLTNTPLAKTVLRLMRLLKNLPMSTVRRATAFDNVNRRVPCSTSPAIALNVKTRAIKLRTLEMMSIQSIFKNVGKISVGFIGGAPAVSQAPYPRNIIGFFILDSESVPIPHPLADTYFDR